MKNQKKLKGAIVGFGFISSKGHFPAYQERSKNFDDVEIIAICDITSSRIQEVPETIKYYTDYIELLFNEAEKLDFIDVSTHPADHYKIAKMALEMGIHVLCEKPLTTTITDASSLLALSLKKKRVIFPCHNYKHSPLVKSIRDIIATHKIGPIKSVTLHTFRNTHALGTQEWEPHWRRKKELSGGGIAMDHGPHSLYLAFEWLRGYPKTVTASSYNSTFPLHDTEDNFSATYEFENGLANVYLTWNAGMRKVIYTIQGEKGAITVNDDSIEISLMEKKSSDKCNHNATWVHENHLAVSDWMDSSHTQWFNSMFDQFKKAIEDNDYINKEAMDAFYCIQAIEKSYESIEKNSTKLKIENHFPNIL